LDIIGATFHDLKGFADETPIARTNIYEMRDREGSGELLDGATSLLERMLTHHL
jgi:hypothetical protein